MMDKQDVGFYKARWAFFLWMREVERKYPKMYARAQRKFREGFLEGRKMRDKNNKKS